MADVRFPQYLKRHGLYVFIAANETYLPGLIFERKGDGFWPHDNLKRLLGENALNWETKLVEADMPDVIVGKRKVGAGGKLKLPFLLIDGGLEKNRFVDFRIGEVRQCIFSDSRLRLWNPLSRLLKRLKERDPKIWDSIKGRYLALSTWYASAYEVDLGGALTGKLDADIQRKISSQAGANLTVDSNEKTLNVSKNFLVPFAFQGKRLIRI